MYTCVRLILITKRTLWHGRNKEGGNKNVTMYVIRRTREITRLPLAQHFSENLQGYGVLLVA